MITTMMALALATAAAPASTPDVDVSETAFDAWILRCETRKAPAPSEKRCGMMSMVKAQDQTGKTAILTSILLRPVSGTGNYQLSFDLPLGVMLQPGARITDAQDKEIVRLPFIACRATGCEAGTILTPAQMGALLASTDKSAVSYDLQNRKSIKMAFSMAGFKTAYEALRKGSPE